MKKKNSQESYKSFSSQLSQNKTSQSLTSPKAVDVLLNQNNVIEKEKLEKDNIEYQTGMEKIGICRRSKRIQKNKLIGQTLILTQNEMQILKKNINAKNIQNKIKSKEKKNLKKISKEKKFEIQQQSLNDLEISAIKQNDSAVKFEENNIHYEESPQKFENSEFGEKNISDQNNLRSKIQNKKKIQQSDTDYSQKTKLYEKIMEKYQFLILPQNKKLMTIAKLKALKVNLINISKSALKQLQIHIFQIFYFILQKIILQKKICGNNIIQTNIYQVPQSQFFEGFEPILKKKYLFYPILQSLNDQKFEQQEIICSENSKSCLNLIRNIEFQIDQIGSQALKQKAFLKQNEENDNYNREQKLREQLKQQISFELNEQLQKKDDEGDQRESNDKKLRKILKKDKLQKEVSRQVNIQIHDEKYQQMLHQSMEPIQYVTNKEILDSSLEFDQQGHQQLEFTLNGSRIVDMNEYLKIRGEIMSEEQIIIQNQNQRIKISIRDLIVFLQNEVRKDSMIGRIAVGLLTKIQNQFF